MPGITLFTDSYDTLGDIEPERRTMLEEFLCGYSEDEGNRIRIQGTRERNDAQKLVDRGHKKFARG